MSGFYAKSNPNLEVDSDAKKQYSHEDQYARTGDI